jgi:hypothetical protein
VSIPNVDPAAVVWPRRWRPIAEASSLFPSPIYPGESAFAELQREICEGHPLYGVHCVPVAYDASTIKEFLFATARPDMPLAVVHFTGRPESDPEWPFVIPFLTLDAFFRSGRCAGRER